MITLLEIRDVLLPFQGSSNTVSGDEMEQLKQRMYQSRRLNVSARRHEMGF